MTAVPVFVRGTGAAREAVIRGGEEGAGLDAALAPPAWFCAEEGADAANLPPDLFLSPETPGDGAALAVAVRAATAYAANLGRSFARAMRDRMPTMEDGAYRDFALAVQEAVGNAVLHGCLDLSTALQQSPDSFHLYAKLLKERLADPAYGGRWISLLGQWREGRVTVAVEDQGTGFDPAQTAARSGSPLGGRGLIIIADLAESVAFANGGRRITMTFRPNAPRPGAVPGEAPE